MIDYDYTEINQAVLLNDTIIPITSLTNLLLLFLGMAPPKLRKNSALMKHRISLFSPTINLNTASIHPTTHNLNKTTTHQPPFSLKSDPFCKNTIHLLQKKKLASPLKVSMND
jgi:hypothetical protein